MLVMVKLLETKYFRKADKISTVFAAILLTKMMLRTNRITLKRKKHHVCSQIAWVSILNIFLSLKQERKKNHRTSTKNKETVWHFITGIHHPTRTRVNYAAPGRHQCRFGRSKYRGSWNGCRRISISRLAGLRGRRSSVVTAVATAIL